MTFQEYLTGRKETYDVSGDVLRLVRASKQKLDITSVEELQSFLAGKGATSVLLMAAEQLWGGYLDYESKAKRRAHRMALRA